MVRPLPVRRCRVLAFAVVQRGRELAIRIALGAPLGRVSWEVLRQGLLLAGAGVLAGTATALGLSWVIQGLLYGWSRRIPPRS